MHLSAWHTFLFSITFDIFIFWRQHGKVLKVHCVEEQTWYLCLGEDDLRGFDSVLLGSSSQNGLGLLHPALREKPSGGLWDEPESGRISELYLQPAVPSLHSDNTDLLTAIWSTVQVTSKCWIITHTVMVKNIGTPALFSDNAPLLPEKCCNYKCFGIHVYLFCLHWKNTKKPNLISFHTELQKWTGENYWHPELNIW